MSGPKNGGQLYKENAERELLEVLCSHSDVAERTLPLPSPPPPQQILLQSQADMAGNCVLGPRGDSRAQWGLLTPEERRGPRQKPGGSDLGESGWTGGVGLKLGW